MENNTKTRRMRKVSSWMSEASTSINNEEEILAGKRIVLKVLRYMEANHITQKELAEKLGVSPQYINKFLHGQDCDIKISTAIRYGKILNLKLIEIPEDTKKKEDKIVIYSINNFAIKAQYEGNYIYNRQCTQPFTLK